MGSCRGAGCCGKGHRAEPGSSRPTVPCHPWPGAPGWGSESNRCAYPADRGSSPPTSGPSQGRLCRRGRSSARAWPMRELGDRQLRKARNTRKVTATGWRRCLDKLDMTMHWRIANLLACHPEPVEGSRAFSTGSRERKRGNQPYLPCQYGGLSPFAPFAYFVVSPLFSFGF